MLHLKLPKDVVADPRHDAVVNLLNRQCSRLWSEGRNEVPTISLNPALSQALRRGRGLGDVSQGLEQIEKQLAREQKGLDLLAQKTPNQPPSPRVSRLLLMANDGSERFYRDCDSLLTRYKQRLLGCKVGLSGEEMGPAFFNGPRLVRAALVTDKKAVAQILLALVEP